MSLEIVPMSTGHASHVRDFNERLRRGNGGFEFPERPDGLGLPKLPDRGIYQEMFLALDDGVVRGGYILKTQPCSFNGRVRDIGNYQLPLSEGIVDPKFGMVGVKIYFDAIRRQPSLYSLGMGGIVRPLPRMLKKMGWFVELVPFFARVVHPQPFFREIVFLRNRKPIRVAIDVARFSGTGWLAPRLWRHASAVARAFPLASSGLRCEQVEDFGAWTDEIWNAASPAYVCANVRNTDALRILYPTSTRGYIRLKISSPKGPVGWALVMATRLKNHKQFGNMHLGSIVDCFAIEGAEFGTIAHSTRFLEKAGVDLIVSNQSHAKWKRALIASGFLQGPSNFGFACSPEITQEFQTLDECHLNRGDGDGPINL